MIVYVIVCVIFYLYHCFDIKTIFDNIAFTVTAELATNDSF